MPTASTELDLCPTCSRTTRIGDTELRIAGLIEAEGRSYHAECYHARFARMTHRHRKGTLYREMHRGRIEADMTPVVVYEGLDGTVWVRPVAEFDDGRFTHLSNATG